MTNRANEIEQALNLKRQISELAEVQDSDFIIKDTSPPARWETVYSTETGEAIPVKRRRLQSVLEKFSSGKQSFTTFKDQAPEYRIGTTLCYFATGSPEFETLQALGIANPVCNARHLANPMAKDLHAEHKHPTRYRTYKEWLDRVEREETRAEQRKQTDAIMALAGGRGSTAVAAPVAEKPKGTRVWTEEQKQALRDRMAAVRAAKTARETDGST